MHTWIRCIISQKFNFVCVDVVPPDFKLGAKTLYKNNETHQTSWARRAGLKGSSGSVLLERTFWGRERELPTFLHTNLLLPKKLMVVCGDLDRQHIQPLKVRGRLPVDLSVEIGVSLAGEANFFDPDVPGVTQVELGPAIGGADTTQDVLGEVSGTDGSHTNDCEEDRHNREADDRNDVFHGRSI